MNWYIKVLRHYADFSGRARRKEYWMFLLFNVIFSVLLPVLAALLFSLFKNFRPEIAAHVVSLSYGVAMLLPGLAVAVRRLHDIGKSGWMLFVMLIPIVGGIWLLVLTLTSGQTGENKYGADPKTAPETFDEAARLKSAGIALIVIFAISILSFLGMSIHKYVLYKHLPPAVFSIVSMTAFVLLLVAGIFLAGKLVFGRSEKERIAGFLLAAFAISFALNIFNVIMAVKYHGWSGLSGLFLSPHGWSVLIAILLHLAMVSLAASVLFAPKEQHLIRNLAISSIAFSVLLLFIDMYLRTGITGMIGIKTAESYVLQLNTLRPIAYIVLAWTIMSVEQFREEGIAASPAWGEEYKPVAKTMDEVKPAANIEALLSPVQYDTEGKMISVVVTPGSWSLQVSGGYKYFSQKAKSLLVAGEILKKQSSIPQQAYYLVDTPDGTLGRDINGFFTEAPIKTKNLCVDYPVSGGSEPVEAQSLTGFGDMIKNHTSVAILKKSGQYGTLILMMKCGQCGYESPVETAAGGMERQCYCCGANNKTSRGPVQVFTAHGIVEV